jgi:histidine triad (HIT) family protein
MTDCIFCKIVEGKIPARLVYENEKIVAFDDIRPLAPVHVIVIPREHIPTLLDISLADAGIMNDLTLAVQEVARIKGIAERGFRAVINCNPEGGQVIYHLHVHVLGGKKLPDGHQ